MNKFWDWYDGLGETHPSLRFAIFMLAITVFYVVIPGIIAFIWGIKYFHPASYVGMGVMLVFALMKTYRWPK